MYALFRKGDANIEYIDDVIFDINKAKSCWLFTPVLLLPSLANLEFQNFCSTDTV